MTREYKFEIWQGASGRYYWRLLAPNKKIIADGGEGYASSSNAKRAVKKLLSVLTSFHPAILVPR